MIRMNTGISGNQNDQLIISVGNMPLCRQIPPKTHNIIFVKGNNAERAFSIRVVIVSPLKIRQIYISITTQMVTMQQTDNLLQKLMAIKGNLIAGLYQSYFFMSQAKIGLAGFCQNRNVSSEYSRHILISAIIALQVF